MVVLAYRKLWCFSTAKINFITHFFLEILQRFCKILILGNVGMPSYDHQSWWHLLVENFIVRQKVKFIPHPEILHRYCKIGILCTLHKHRHIFQKQYQLKGCFDTYYIQRDDLIPKESCWWLWWIVSVEWLTDKMLSLFQPTPLSEILTTTNLWHTMS